jgi:hypothetical protein
VFVAEAEISRVSVPWETPVICQDAVAVPVDRVAMLYVGAATEKRPFCEVNIKATLVN